HILAVLSGVFPDGEDYFVRSVAAVRDEISDPDLCRDVDGFIGQEEMHGREHRTLNDRLAELGYPSKAIGVYVRWLFRTRERIATMWLTHLTFVLETSIWTAISLSRDPVARRHPLRVAKSAWRLRESPFTKPKAVRQLLQYTHRGFHPNDRDTRKLIADWRA